MDNELLAQDESRVESIDPAEHENKLNEVVEQVYAKFMKLVKYAGRGKIATNIVFVKSPLFAPIRHVIREFNAVRAPLTAAAKTHDQTKRADPNDIAYICDKLMLKFGGRIEVGCALRKSTGPELHFKAMIPIEKKRNRSVGKNFTKATIVIYEYRYAFVFKPAISYEEYLLLSEPA